MKPYLLCLLLFLPACATPQRPPPDPYEALYYRREPLYPPRVLCPRLDGSTVREVDSAVTAMAWTPFYDSKGRKHVHDPNRVTVTYRCSEGHTFTDQDRTTCWCGWPKRKWEEK